MSNNRYKNAFNQIEVSDRAIDNLYDIATKKQRRTNNVAKKIIATATAFVLVIGGGFGINYSISDKKSVGIYVASADEVASIKNANSQDFTYKAYIADDADKQEIMSKWQKDKQKLMNEAEKLGDDNYSASIRSGSSIATNGNKDYDFYTLSSGNFTVNTGDIDNVKKLTLENQNKYAELSVMVYNDDSTDWNICAKKIEISGDRLKKSYDSKVCSFSNGRFKKEINFGNSFTWDLSNLSSYINETDKIDFNDLNDTIIASVEYKDCSIIKRGFNIEFDKNGVAHFSEFEVK